MRRQLSCGAPALQESSALLLTMILLDVVPAVSTVSTPCPGAAAAPEQCTQEAHEV